MKAAEGADVLYTDVWASMGEEAEHEERVKKFQGYQINQALLDVARPDAMVLHCLPAHRGKKLPMMSLKDHTLLSLMKLKTGSTSKRPLWLC